MQPGSNSLPAGVLCVVSIFLPSFLLVAGTLPFWDMLRGCAGMQAAMQGVNAVVVGLVLAALFSTMWLGSVSTPADFLSAFLLLAARQVPPWIVVLVGAVAASGLAATGVAISTQLRARSPAVPKCLGEHGKLSDSLRPPRHSATLPSGRTTCRQHRPHSIWSCRAFMSPIGVAGIGSALKGGSGTGHQREVAGGALQRPRI